MLARLVIVGCLVRGPTCRTTGPGRSAAARARGGCAQQSDTWQRPAAAVRVLVCAMAGALRRQQLRTTHKQQHSPAWASNNGCSSHPPPARAASIPAPDPHRPLTSHPRPLPCQQTYPGGSTEQFESIAASFSASISKDGEYGSLRSVTPRDGCGPLQQGAPSNGTTFALIQHIDQDSGDVCEFVTKVGFGSSCQCRLIVSCCPPTPPHPTPRRCRSRTRRLQAMAVSLSTLARAETRSSKWAAVSCRERGGGWGIVLGLLLLTPRLLLAFLAIPTASKGIYVPAVFVTEDAGMTLINAPPYVSRFRCCEVLRD